MRSLSRIAASCILIGCALNVLVAWACAYLVTTRTFDAMLLGRLRAEAYRSMPADGSDPYLALVFVGFGCRTLEIEEGDDVAWQHVSGWPWLSMAGEQRTSGSPQPGERLWWSFRSPRRLALVFGPLIRGGAGAAGAPLFPVRTVDGILPLRPLGAAFTLNSLFYAAVLWLVWTVPALVRGMVRHLRGCCPRCGYPIGPSERCSECGRVIKGRRGGSRAAKLSA